MGNKLGQEPAFACECISANGSDGHIQEGMSKRFYAACAAMQGILSGQDYRRPIANDEVVKVAYELADKLLEQENQ